MTRQEKLKLSRVYLRFSVKLERDLQRKIQPELNRYVKACNNRFLQSSNYFDDIDKQHFDNILRILIRHYQVVIPKMSNWVYERIGKEVKASVLDQVQTLVNWYIQNKGVVSAKNISDTSRKKLRNVLEKSATEGLGINEIAKNIMKLRVVNSARSVVIAKTETHAASNWGNYETAKVASKQFNIQFQKEWIPVDDDRTRDTHAEMLDHPAIDLDDYFDVGGYKAQQPLASTLPPEEVVNCRCVLGFVEKEYDIS